VVAGYVIAFICLTLRTAPVGIAYAIWAGCQIVLMALMSYAPWARNSTLRPSSASA